MPLLHLLSHKVKGKSTTEVTDDLFSPDPRSRLHAARAASEAVRRRTLAFLSEGCPHKPWPRGMPTSVNPLVVVIGVSPGNSPALGAKAFLEDYTPTFGLPAPGLFYRDQAYYWQKVRLLGTSMTRLLDHTLSDQDGLALTGHLNLGTGMFGSASRAAIEPDVVRWVSDVIARCRARLVIALGLVKLLTTDEVLRGIWNDGAAVVDWTQPQLVAASTFRYRLFRGKGPNGTGFDLVFWPNHPSRAPFGGRPRVGGRWESSIGAACDWLRPRATCN